MSLFSFFCRSRWCGSLHWRRGQVAPADISKRLIKETNQPAKETHERDLFWNIKRSCLTAAPTRTTAPSTAANISKRLIKETYQPTKETYQATKETHKRDLFLDKIDLCTHEINLCKLNRSCLTSAPTQSTASSTAADISKRLIKETYQPTKETYQPTKETHKRDLFPHEIDLCTHEIDLCTLNRSCLTSVPTQTTAPSTAAGAPSTTPPGTNPPKEKKINSKVSPQVYYCISLCYRAFSCGWRPIRYVVWYTFSQKKKKLKSQLATKWTTLYDYATAPSTGAVAWWNA